MRGRPGGFNSIAGMRFVFSKEDYGDDRLRSLKLEYRIVLVLLTVMFLHIPLSWGLFRELRALGG